MKRIVSVVLTADTYDGDKLDELNALPWYRCDRGLASSDFDKRPDTDLAWYGGSKYLTMCVWIGAFSELNVDDLVAAMRQIDWNEAACVRLYVSEGDRERFRRIEWQEPGKQYRSALFDD